MTMLKILLQVPAKCKRSGAMQALSMPKTLEIHEMRSEYCTVEQDTMVSDELNPISAGGGSLGPRATLKPRRTPLMYSKLVQIS